MVSKLFNYFVKWSAIFKNCFVKWSANFFVKWLTILLNGQKTFEKAPGNKICSGMDMYSLHLRFGYTDKNSATKRRVEARHWDPSDATHFNEGILTRTARVFHVKIPSVKCVNWLGSQWLAEKYRFCCRMFLTDANKPSPMNNGACGWAKTWKSFSFRGPMWGLRASLKSRNTIVLCDGMTDSRGCPQLGTRDYRETPGSRTAVRMIGVVFPAWRLRFIHDTLPLPIFKWHHFLIIITNINYRNYYYLSP